MYNTLYIIIICFADDTWLSMKIDVDADYAKLQEDLNAVIEWSTKNNMQLHEDKFELLSLNCRNDAIKELPFGNKNCHYDTANGVTIYPTDSTRDLGVIISEQICGGKKIYTLLLPEQSQCQPGYSMYSMAETRLQCSPYTIV